MELLPRILVYKNKQEGQLLITVRWFKNGLDLLKEKESIFIQFGNQPVKFLYLTRKDVRPPMFLLSPRWKTKLKIKNLRLGTTTKPRDLSKPWRILCKNDSAPKGNLNSIGTLSSGTGRAQQTRG
jgi:hypothetical protein